MCALPCAAVPRSVVFLAWKLNAARAAEQEGFNVKSLKSSHTGFKAGTAAKPKKNWKALLAARRLRDETNRLADAIFDQRHLRDAEEAVATGWSPSFDFSQQTSLSSSPCYLLEPVFSSQDSLIPPSRPSETATIGHWPVLPMAA